MDEKTKHLVEAAEKRATKASAGPWVRWKGGDGRCVMQGPASQNTIGTFRGSVPNGDGQIAECDDLDSSPSRARANAAFIAHARSDVPALCAIVREQDAEIEQLRRHSTGIPTLVQAVEAEAQRDPSASIAVLLERVLTRSHTL